MEIAAIVFDAVLIVIFLYYFLKNWRMGFLASLFKLLGFAIACFGAYIGSRALAETVYQLFLRQKLIKTMSEALATSGITDVATSVQTVIDTVPKAFRGFFVDFFGGSQGVTNEIGDLMTTSVESMSVAVTDDMLYPIIYTVLQAVFFILLFFAVMIIVRGLSKILRGVRNIPLLGPVNSILGGVLGILQGLLVVVVLVLALNLINGVTGNSIAYINEDTINQTYIFKEFYEWNPIGGISASEGDLGFKKIGNLELT